MIVKQYQKNRTLKAESDRAELLKGKKIEPKVTGTGTAATLRRMKQIMALELEKGAGNMAALDNQANILKKTHQEYSAMSNVLSHARQKLSFLESKDRTDKLLMLFACLVFSCVVLYIVHKRLFS